MLELENAIKLCKNGAPGDDGIHYSVLKNLPENANLELLKLLNKSWQTGTAPDTWNEAVIIPLLKPNKPIKRSRVLYRPISLTSTFTKLMQTRAPRVGA